jgi:hypothetical protein
MDEKQKNAAMLALLAGGAAWFMTPKKKDKVRNAGLTAAAGYFLVSMQKDDRVILDPGQAAQQAEGPSIEQQIADTQARIQTKLNTGGFTAEQIGAYGNYAQMLNTQYLVGAISADGYLGNLRELESWIDQGQDITSIYGGSSLPQI